MRLSQISPKLHKYIHPTFRAPLLRRHKKRRRVVKRKALNLIRRKYLFLDIKPRIPPLHCPRCGLATRFSSTIINHNCLGNIHQWRGTGSGACAEYNTLGDDEIDEDLLAMGGRNRMRDGMGILERFARPQNVILYNINYNTSDNSANTPSTLRSVPTLSELVMRKLAPARTSFISTPSEKTFEKRSLPIISKKKIGRSRCHGHFCPPCGRLFASFSDYDSHLESKMDKKGKETNSCREVPPNPVPLLLNDRGNAPAEHDFTSRNSIVKKKVNIVDKCTACGMGGFQTTLQLHTHIIECAKRIEYQRINDTLNKKRHLLHNK